jgi:hypothetical protein
MADRAALDGFLADDPCTTAGLHDALRIHRWTTGGAANIRAAGLMR